MVSGISNSMLGSYNDETAAVGLASSIIFQFRLFGVKTKESIEDLEQSIGVQNNTPTAGVSAKEMTCIVNERVAAMEASIMNKLTQALESYFSKAPIISESIPVSSIFLGPLLPLVLLILL